MPFTSKSGQKYNIESSLVELSTVKMEEIMWVWEPYLPVGKLVIIDGDGAAGKTTLLLDIAARMSKGKDMPDGSSVGVAGVVYVTFEDGIADTIVPRLSKAGANLNNIKVIKDVFFENEKGEQDSRPFSLSEDLELLSLAIMDVNAKLIVIDPILSAIDGDSYKDQEVRKALAPLVNFAQNEGVTVVMIRHYSKQRTENINHKGIGSVAFINMSRVGLAVAPDPEDEEGMLLMHTKHNLTKEAKSLKYKLVSDDDKIVYVQWNGKSNLTHNQIMSTTKQGSLQQEIISLLSRCEDDVELESKYIEDYCEKKGYGRTNTRNTLGRMRESGAVKQTARGKYMGTLPKLEAVA